MTTYEILKLNASLLNTLSKNDIKAEDVNYIEMFETYNRLVDEGLKIAYIIAHLVDEYSVSERTIRRIVKKFKQGVRL